MIEIRLIPREEFDRLRAAVADPYERLGLFADMCRANALATVKKAGSGHLGSSFSCLDVATHLYWSEMNTLEVGVESPDRDVYFSSKGHDAPGQYAVFYALGLIPKEMFVNLRRLGGTHGHPDLSIPGVEANSGSLGMGISKAKGIALAKAMKGAGGRVFVMTGDGELQEGQIWESLQTTAFQGVTNLCVIVDANKIQTDKPVEQILDLGDLEAKFRVFGWHVERCDGHDPRALEAAFRRLGAVGDKPKALIADTVKGRGVSFMEGPQALRDGNGLYRWHAGAPDDDSFEAGHREIVERIDGRLKKLGAGPLRTEVIETRPRNRTRLKDTAEKVVTAYGEALVELGKRRKDLVVLDADLAVDCGVRGFQEAFPDRFVENGIAEQDMVSMAGGLALHGFVPVVNSFGVFLASRANEQIYNNATEHTRIVYVCHYAGLIPAGPGKSHQSLRDVSLFGALPNCVILEPCNAVETRQAIEWCVESAPEVSMLRLAISPSPRVIPLPEGYRLTEGRGCIVRDGTDAVLFAYGPVMLHEALLAADRLAEQGTSLKVVNMPWLNRADPGWVEGVMGECDTAFVVDNHSPYGGLGDCLRNCETMRGRRLVKFAVDDFPACGTPPEALRHHGLDGESLARRIVESR